MVKKNENIVLDMTVSRLVKGSQEAKDFMKKLREKRSKGGRIARDDATTTPPPNRPRPRRAPPQPTPQAPVVIEQVQTATRQEPQAPAQRTPQPPIPRRRRGRELPRGHVPPPFPDLDGLPNEPLPQRTRLTPRTQLSPQMESFLNDVENELREARGRGLADVKKKAYDYIIENIDKISEKDLEKIKDMFLRVKGKGLFSKIGSAFKKVGKAAAKTATLVGKKISREATDTAYKTGDFVKSEKGLKKIGKYAVPATVGMLAGIATGGNPLASAAAGAATGAAYDKVVMGKGGLIAQEAFGEGISGGIIEGDVDMAQKSRYSRVPIKRLSSKQMTSMRKGRGVRCVKAPCPSDEMGIMVDAMNKKKLDKAFMKGKGITIALSPEELNCNKTEMKGEGIFGRWGDKVMKKLGVKDIAYKVGDIAKPFVKDALKKAAVAIPMALGQPELVPLGMIAANIGSKYLDKPSDFQRPAEKAIKVIQGKKDFMEAAVEEGLPAMAKSTINDYIQRYGSQVLEQAVQSAKQNLGLVRPNENSPYNYAAVAGNGIYSRGGCCGAGLMAGSGLTGGSAFVGQGIYAGSNRVIGGQVGEHKKGMIDLRHPAMKSRADLEDVKRKVNQY